MKPLFDYKRGRPCVQMAGEKRCQESNGNRNFSAWKLSSIAMVFVLSLAACGGGSGGGGGGTTGGVTAGTTTLSGTVTGGPGIINSAVSLYMTNGTQAPSPLGTTQSLSDGSYVIHYSSPTTSGHLLYVVASGGQTSSTGSANTNINLVSIVGLSGETLPSKVVVNELTTSAVAYAAAAAGLSLNGTSISGSSSALLNLNTQISNIINPVSGTISSSTALSSANQSDLLDLANGMETCVLSASSCTGTFAGTLSNIETAAANLVTNNTTAPITVSSVGSTSGSFSTASNASANAATLLGTLITATVDSSNNAELETYPFTAAGTIPAVSPTTTVSMPSGQLPAGGGFDSSFNVYAVVTVNAAGTSESVTLYNYNPTNGFGSVINSQTLTALSGNTCNGGGGINPLTHALFMSCSGSAGQQNCLYFYDASGLQSCFQPTFPSSVNSNSILGDNGLNFVWVRSRTQTTGSTAYSFSGVFSPIYSSSSVSVGAETSFGPVNFTVPSQYATNFGVDNSYGLLFYSAYCGSGPCTSEPLDVLTFNTSTGVISSNVNSSQSLAGNNIVSSSLSSNSGETSAVDSTEKLFFMESYTSGISFTPYNYNSSGTVTALTALTLSSFSSPNGNSNAMMDPNSRFIFVPEGTSNTATGVETVLYNNTGTISDVLSTISLPSGQLVPSCSSNCNNEPNFMFDAVN